MLLPTSVHILVVLAGIHGTVRAALDVELTRNRRGGTTAYRLGAGQVSIDNQLPAQRYLIDLPASVQRLRIVVGHHEVMRWPEDSVRLTRGHETRATRVVLDLAHPGVP
jgi:hypothetical protein